MGLDHVRPEIEHMRVQVGKQRKEILQLQRAGLSTASAELLLGRMYAKIASPQRRGALTFGGFPVAFRARPPAPLNSDTDVSY